MCRNQARDNARVSAVEEIELHDDSRPRLAGISGRRTNDDIAALYLRPDVSANPYQSSSCSCLETSSIPCGLFRTRFAARRLCWSNPSRIARVVTPPRGHAGFRISLLCAKHPRRPRGAAR